MDEVLKLLLRAGNQRDRWAVEKLTVDHYVDQMMTLYDAHACTEANVRAVLRSCRRNLGAKAEAELIRRSRALMEERRLEEHYYRNNPNQSKGGT